LMHFLGFGFALQDSLAAIGFKFFIRQTPHLV
jgi:hypothetical protein